MSAIWLRVKVHIIILSGSYILTFNATTDFGKSEVVLLAAAH